MTPPDETAGSAAIVTAEDSANFYRLALMREAESADAVESAVGTDIRDTFRRFFMSDEFVLGTLSPLRQGRLPAASLKRPGADLTEWVARRLELTESTRVRLPTVCTQLQLYDLILNDAQSSRIYGEPSPVVDEVTSTLLKTASGLQGMIDHADDHFVRGWALRHGAGKKAVRIECWVDAAFVGASQTKHRRPDLDTRSVEDHLAGFEIALPPSTPIRRGRLIEIREAMTGFVIGSLKVPASEPAFSLNANLRLQIQSLRNEIENLSSALDTRASNILTPIADYGAYYERWRLSAEAGPETFSALCVLAIIDGIGADLSAIENSLDSVVEQRHPNVEVALIVEPKDHLAAEDLANRTQRRSGAMVDVRVVTRGANWRLDLGLPTSIALVHLLPAGVVLHPDALSVIATAAERQQDVGALYIDEDTFDRENEATPSAIRRAPLLKPDFDRELLLQFPFCGYGVTFSKELWIELRTNQALVCGPLLGSALLLDIPPTRIRHIASLLASRPPRMNAALAGWSKIVENHLIVAEPRAHVLPRNDILGVSLPFACRISRSAEGVSTTVIVPSKDRLDLLQPCLESLLDTRKSNKATMNILVIDHESTDPETLAYLDHLEDTKKIDRMTFKGAFNWALMNNLAAAHCKTDILVFLNNDTVVLSRDWLDELASQAIREEIGAVGCRLLYEDGTLQHAGFVTREFPEGFLTHEGVGEEGSDGGYLGRHALVHETSAVTGACMAVRRDLFEALGGFDAGRFPVDGNDVDFCFKARAAGFSIIYNPHATLYHLESKTRGYGATPKARRAATLSVRRLWKKWGERFGYDPYFNPNFARTGQPFSHLRSPRNV